jgi:hypothetical protein
MDMLHVPYDIVNVYMASVNVTQDIANVPEDMVRVYACGQGHGTYMPQDMIHYPRHRKRYSYMLNMSINMIQVFLYMIQFSIDMVYVFLVPQTII